MQFPVVLAVAVGLFGLTVIAVLVWVQRLRTRPQTPVTEADARAHASPLTTSVLSVSPRPEPGGRGSTDT